MNVSRIGVFLTLMASVGSCGGGSGGSGPVQGAVLQVLFLGNSYTQVNDLPGLLTFLAESGGHAVTTAANAPGGNTLGSLQPQGAPHVSNATSLALIASDAWDYVDTMQAALTAAYAEVGIAIGASVVPVGEAWRTAMRADPTIDLHEADGSHPNLLGSYLAACTFYAEIFDDNPVGLSFTAGLSAAEAALLQQAAWDTVAGLAPPSALHCTRSAFPGAVAIRWAMFAAAVPVPLVQELAE